jgi:hypothetical protein
MGVDGIRSALSVTRILSMTAAGSSRIRSGSLVVVTSNFIVLKPGELTESVPYACALNTVKLPAASVSVRIVFPFDANSTEAFAIALPLGSETTPEILVSCCCA